MYDGSPVYRMALPHLKLFTGAVHGRDSAYDRAAADAPRGVMGGPRWRR
jgi:hypothetical protein